MKKLLTVILALISLQGFAQNIITSINITLPPNPDASTVNWGTGTSPFVITASTRATGGGIDPSVEESKILVIIKQNGKNVCGSYTSNSAPAAEFNAPVKVWSGNNAASLLGKGCTLPPGDYELSIQFFGNGAAGIVPLSDEKTKPFTIKGNDQQSYQAPQAISPADQTEFKEADIMKPLTFRWTPVIPRPQYPVSYRLTVWQLMQGQTGGVAIKANQPIIIKDVDNITQAIITNLITGPCKPPYLCDFVWNVQALNRDGKPVGGNNGTSEPATFRKGGIVIPFDTEEYAHIKLISPANKTVFSNADVSKAVIFSWAPPKTDTKELVRYRLRIWQLKQGQTGGIAITAEAPIIIKDVDNLTQVAVNNLSIGPCKPPYLCDFVWNVQALNRDGKPIGGNNGTSENFNFSMAAASCGSIVADSTVKCNGVNPRTGLPVYSITITLTNKPTSGGLGCDAKYSSVAVWSGGGTISLLSALPVTIAANNSATISFNYSPASSGSTTAAFKINGVWNDALGNSVNSLVDVGLPACVTCGCGGWNVLIVNRNQKFECGSKMVIPWKCGQPFSFSSAYQCSPSNDKSCQAKTSWVITQNGAVIKTGASTGGVGDSFTPTANGTYVITLNAVCNGIKCPPCSYTISVEDCCSCGKWGSLQIPQLVGKIAGFNCGETIQWTCSQPLNFTNTYQCDGTNESMCRPVTSWEASLNGAVIKTGTGTGTLSGSFIPTANGTYTITLNAVCNGIKCPPCTYSVVVADCCSCGTWSPLIVNQTAAVAGIKYNCGSTIKWNCSKPFSFTDTYQCGSKNCRAVTSWQVTQGATVIQSGNGTGAINGGFTLTANGTYTITLNATCNGIKCPPCTYTVVVADCCTCGGWGVLTVNRNQKFECGSKMVIPWKCNEAFNFTSAYQCSPNNDKSCQAKTSWVITKDGVVIKTGSGAGSAGDSFTPAGNGTYVITLNAVCNGIKCPACSYTISVDDCKNCTCGNWGTFNIGLIRATGRAVIKSLAPTKYACGSTINWPVNQPLNFTSTFQCIGTNDKACQPVSSWQVKLGGAVIAAGSGNGALSGSFTPTASGTYTITLNASCDGSQCAPCVEHVQVTEPCPTLCNGDFEQILNGQAPSGSVQTDEDNIPCWKTTASDHAIEIWHSGFGSISAHTGTYFAEINATMIGALYQTFTINLSHTIAVSFAHRGRYAGMDEMKVSLIYPNGTSLLLGTYDDNKQAWKVYTTPSHTIAAGTYTLKFESVYSDGGNGPPNGGNFLDSVNIICTAGNPTQK